MESNKYRILKLFFNMPMSKFRVRWLSRFTKLDTKTVMNYLKNFVKEGIVIRKKPRNHYPYYESNRLSKIYRYEKSNIAIKKIIKSKLIEYLEKKLHPEAIVLFGSIQKGTYYKKSDVDLFIKVDYKKVDLSKYEKKIGYKITPLFEQNLKNLSRGLLQNIYNGYVLSGNLKVI